MLQEFKSRFEYTSVDYYVKVQELKKPTKLKNKKKVPTLEDLIIDVQNSLISSCIDDFESYSDFEMLKDTYYKLSQFEKVVMELLARQK